MKPTCNGNVIIIHGGGLVDPSKFVLLRIARNLSNVYNTVFIGKYSFEALYTPEFWLRYTNTTEEFLKAKRGTYFGTCRGIDLTDPILLEKAISCLKEKNVTTIVVAGGDGSSRQVAEINNKFSDNGINIIFAVPLTIDGINGGESIGIGEAVGESIRQIRNIVSTSLETRDNGEFGVAMVELQGRNRDDIIANVLKVFHEQQKIADCEFSDLFIRVVPSTLETDEEKLVEEINQTSKRTIVFVSEGAKIKIAELTKKINRKVRSLVVGYSSQSNGLTSLHAINNCYNGWIDIVTCEFIARDPYSSYCITKNGKEYAKKSIDYYAKLNPKEGQKPELDDELIRIMKNYM